MSNVEQTGSGKVGGRAKLGLALAGGGFRAALFHLGVVRRLAEFDLLRHVEVISTVSGGSIVGALYIDFLRRKLLQDPNKVLTRKDYLWIASALQERVLRGIRTDLRTRLLLNPLRVFWMIVGWKGLDAHLARLFDRHFFDAPRWSLWRPRTWRPSGLRGIRLRDLHVERAAGVLPRLIINATSLNAGDRFWFSRDEVGDWRLGQFAYDDIDDILRLKPLWDADLGTLRGAAEEARRAGQALIGGRAHVFEELWMVAWLRQADLDPPERWKRFAVRSIRDIEDLGYLRQATRAAKLLDRQGIPAEAVARADCSDGELWDRFWYALRIIDDAIVATLKESPRDALEFVVALYRSKTTRAAATSLKQAFDRLTLAEAVAASASFPPVLPSYGLSGFYDDRTVGALGLTDGGVFENSGVQALLDEHCNRIIVSDSSAPFRVRRRGSIGRFRMMYRITDSLTTGVSWRQQIRMTTLRDTGAIASYAWIDVDGPAREPEKSAVPPLALDLNGHALARLRTDLDAFGDVEIAALVNHGYDRADRYLRKYVIGDGAFADDVRWTSPPNEPYPRERLPDRERLDTILWVGRARFWRAVRLWWISWLPWSLLVSITALAGIVATALSERLRDAAISAGQTAAASLNERLSEFSGLHPALSALATYHASWRTALVAVLVVLSLQLVGSATVGHELETRIGVGRANLRRLALLGARTRDLWLNLLWLLGPLPVIAAIVIPAGAWISMQLFGRPFRRATRLRPAREPGASGA